MLANSTVCVCILCVLYTCKLYCVCVRPTAAHSTTAHQQFRRLQSMVRLLSSNNNEALTHHLKIPVGDGPYVRAKQVQLVERDPDRAIALFWAAINVGDRVDSALKDMAVVMKQQNRGEEAIQAILSFRHLCSPLAQESLDNVLLDLYKKCGRLDDQIELLKHKLSLIHEGMVFNGKRTKTARSQGKKFQISIRQEATRLLGNLGWAYMQLYNYVAAEVVYRKALTFDADNNKLCNLGVCLLKQCKYEEARVVLAAVTPARPSADGRPNLDSNLKSYERCRSLLRELQGSAQINPRSSSDNTELPSADNQDHSHELLITPQEYDLWTHWKLWESPSPSNPASSTTEISGNRARICTNSALNYPQTSSTLNESDGINPILSGFTCDRVDSVLGGAGMISHTTRKDVGSFKREIGPSSTVHQSKAKKNTLDDEKIGGGFLNFPQDNHFGKMGTNLVSPTMIKNPVARRLVLEGSTTSQKDEKSDNTVEYCAHAIQDSVEPMDMGRCCRRDVIDVIEQDLHMNLCTSNASFNGGGLADAIGTTLLDFNCVDRVIENIVPDALSASQSILKINADIVNNDACAVDRIGQRHIGGIIDGIFAYSRPIPPTHGESMESLIRIHQHRLKVFQLMTLVQNQPLP